MSVPGDLVGTRPLRASSTSCRHNRSRQRPLSAAPSGRAIGEHCEGLKVLADAGVLRQISAGTYDRQYAADELFELIEGYEADVADRTRRPNGPTGTSSW